MLIYNKNIYAPKTNNLISLTQSSKQSIPKSLSSLEKPLLSEENKKFLLSLGFILKNEV